ncbi:MAG TPA: TonB-dependent receptor [Acidobacteriota bacterium]|nr:TonB-dependent receptor [Acidobacteriota bacterium]
MTKKFLFTLLALSILLCQELLLAQGIGITTGTLAGEAVDESGRPLPGVIISAYGVEGTKTTSTDVKGKYIFPYLTPGNYDVRAELQGYTPLEQNDIRVGLRQRLELSFKMKESVHEEVTVTNETPLVDLASSTTVTNISDQLIERIPIGRSLADVVYMAPGVVNTGIGGANFSISGASGWENTYIVDGVNVTSPGFGGLGSLSRFHGFQGDSFLRTEMIKEVQVITAGFEAEYGEAQGGVINVITKAGNNNFHGQGYLYTSPQNAGTLLERGDYDLDSGIEIGGPILKNKLFFYTAYNLTRSKTTIFLNPKYPGYSVLPVMSNNSDASTYTTKITSNLTDNHSLEFSASGGPTHLPLSIHADWQIDTAVDPRMAQSDWYFGTNSQRLRWNGVLNPNMFLEAQVARTFNEFEITPTSISKDIPRITDWTAGENPLDIGGFGGDFSNKSTNMQYSAKFTNLWKNHQFRYGLQFEDIWYSDFNIRTGGPFTFPDGTIANHGYRVNVLLNDQEERYYVVDAAIGRIETNTKSKYLNWFAQDSWSITPDLNLTLGVRWERQKLREVNEDFEFAFNNNWAPRIGATYDYLKNDNSKLFFHYGRFFERLPNFAAANLTTWNSKVAAYSDAELTHYLPGFDGSRHSALFSGRAISGVEGHGEYDSPFVTRAGYSNEWSGGIEQEVKPGFSLGANFVFRNLGRVVETIRLNQDSPCITLADGYCIQPAMTIKDWMNNSPFTGLLTNVDGHIPGVPELTRKYKALVITAEKRLSNRSQLTASYRYAQLTGNYTGQDRTGAADFATSDFTQFNYAEGPLPDDIRHMVKLFGSYQVNDNLNTGVSFYFETGRPITSRREIIFGPLGAADSFPITPRGALGRTDSVTNIDIHADYSLTFWKDQRLTVGIDVFNIFNSEAVTDVNEIQVRYWFYSRTEPDYNPSFLNPLATQTPRSVRLLLRYSF